VQIARDLAEAQSGAGGAQTGHVFLHIGSDYPFQSHMAVVHDDVDGRHGLKAITRQDRIAVNGAGYLQAQPVVHGR